MSEGYQPNGPKPILPPASSGAKIPSLTLPRRGIVKIVDNTGDTIVLNVDAVSAITESVISYFDDSNNEVHGSKIYGSGGVIMEVDIPMEELVKQIYGDIKL